jgi:hypothetical protein
MIMTAVMLTMIILLTIMDGRHMISTTTMSVRAHTRVHVRAHARSHVRAFACAFVRLGVSSSMCVGVRIVTWLLGLVA